MRIGEWGWSDGFVLAEGLAAGGLLLLMMTMMGRCALVSGRMAALGTQLRMSAQEAVGGDARDYPRRLGVTVRLDGEVLEWEMEVYQRSEHIFGIGEVGDRKVRDE